MSDSNTLTPPAEGKQLTAVEAAKRVRRTVTGQGRWQ